MKRYQLVFLSVLTGFLLSLPWQGLFPGWILFGALVSLFFVEDYFFQRKELSASFDFFGYAFLSFFVWNSLSTWWIMYASLFGMLLIVLLNALIMATVWWLFHQLKRFFNTRLGNLSLIVFWLAFEYLHYNWEIEWPWLSLGNGFANQVEMVQWYEYTGVLGGTLWILILNLLLFKTLKYLAPGITVKAILNLVLFVLLIVIPVTISKFMYNHYEESGKPYEIVILQPNIDPYDEKFDENTENQQLQSLLQLADSLVSDSTDYVVGPETALHPLWEDDHLLEDPQVLPFYRRANKYPKLNFVLGATTQLIFQPNDTLPETVRKFATNDLYYDVYNSALQINHKHNIQIYHKSILVSGVEKMPFSKYFSFVEKFIVDLGGTTGSLGRQKEPNVFVGTSGLKVGPVICFESAFGAYVSKYVRKGAEMIFVITNDGWWKKSPGYRQHLSYSRLRAIETRRSIARSANTGASAFINQRGDLLKKTSCWTKTAIIGNLKANEEITFYVTYGDYSGRVSLFITVMLLLYFFIQKKIRKSF